MYNRLADASLWLEQSIAAARLAHIAVTLTVVQLSAAVVFVLAGAVDGNERLLVYLVAGAGLMLVAMARQGNLLLARLLVGFGSLGTVMLLLSLVFFLGIVAGVIWGLAFVIALTR